MTRMDGGEILVRALEREGVRAIFAIADISYAPVLRSAEAHGLRVIGGRHESAEVHMADAWARSTGQTAVAMAGMGPGVSNLVPGVVNAWIEGIPVVVIATQRTQKVHYAVRRGRFQHTPQVDLFRPVTKLAVAVPDAARMADHVREAFRAALSGRPGPAYLEICDDILRQEVDVDQVAWPGPEAYRAAPGGVDDETLRQLTDRVVAAERPLVVAGGGVERAEASEAVREVARRLGAVTMTTLGARGLFDEDGPGHVLFNSPGGGLATREADLVLAVGTPVGEVLGFGRPPRWGEIDRQRWVQIDVEPTAIGVNRPVDLGVVGDARRVLEGMVRVLRGRNVQRPLSRWAGRCGALCSEARLAVREVLGNASADPIHPARLAREVADRVPEGTRMCFDGGNTTVWAHLFHRFRRPRSLLWTSHFGHLGTGLPYAIGAKLAEPARPVVLYSGDGAFGFNVQELETAAREGANIVCVVSCDFAWGMEVTGLTLEIGRPIGAATSAIRYDHVARGFGCHGELVETADQIAPALERAFAANRPAVVQVLVDAKANANPPGLLELAQMYAGAG
jgi:acetolactate synthase I/II/III large subunit